MLDERWPPDVGELSAGLRSLLDKECTPDAVRAAEARPDGRDEVLEERLTAFGLWDLPTDAAMLSAAAWETGRAIAPIPYAECAGVAAVLGIKGATCGLEGAVPVPPSNTVIYDTKGDVLLAAVTERPRRTTAGDLLAVPPTSGTFDRVGDREHADRIERLARLLHAARLMGAAERLLEAGADHVKRRTQFGKPIGAFQAVAHMLADAAIALDGAMLLLRKTAWVADRDGERVPSWAFAPMVWAKAVDAGRIVSSAVHQSMGGYGFTVEEDTQLYSRRIRSWTLRLPGQGPELAALGRSLLDPLLRDSVRHLWHHDEGIPLPRWAEETDRRGPR